MHKRLLTFIIAFLFLTVGFGQTVLTGFVLDSERTGIPGAHVSLVYAKQVGVTDANGVFKFSVKPGSYLIRITAVGFDTLLAQVSPSQKLLEFTLSRSIHAVKAVTIEAHRSIMAQTTTGFILNEEDLEKHTSTTVANVLASQPGVRSMNTGAGVGKPVIRGMSGNRIQVISQGIKQEGQQWGNDHGLEIDPFEYQRVELIQGASALRYGSDATGGVVKLLPSTAPKNGQLIVTPSLLYRSNNDLFAGSVHLEKGFAKSYLKLRFTQSSAGDFTVPATNFTYNTYNLPIYNEKLKNTAYKEQHYSAACGLKGKNINTELSYTGYGLKTGLFPGAMGIPRTYDLQHDGDYRNIDLPYQKVQHHKVAAKGVLDFGEKHIHINLGYQKNKREEHSEPHYHGIPDDSTSTLALGLDLQTISLNTYLETGLTKKISMELGVAGSIVDNKIEGYEYLIPNYSAYNFGVFGMVKIGLADAWNATLGLRYDWANYDAGGAPSRIRNVSGGLTEVASATAGFNKVFQGVSGAAGIAWEPSAIYEQKLNLAKTYRTPNIAELAGDGIHHGTYRHERGDEALEQEEGWQVDWSHHYKLAPFHVVLNGYYYYFKNYIYLNPFAFFSELPDGGQVYQYVQNRARMVGGELKVNYQVTNRLALSEQFDLVVAKNLDTKLPLPFIPPMRNNLELSYELPIKLNVKTFVRWEYVFEQSRVERNERTTTDASLIHAGIQGNLKVRGIPVIWALLGENIFNVPFYDHLSRYRQLNIPEPGRNFSIRVKVPIELGKAS